MHLFVLLASLSVEPLPAQTLATLPPPPPLRAGITSAERRQREIMGELFLLNQNLREASEKGARLSSRRAREEAHARALAAEVQTLDKNLRVHRAAFSARLRQLYRTPAESPLAPLFSREPLSDRVRAQKFLALLAKDDQARLKSFSKLREEHAAKYADLKVAVGRLKQIENHAVSVATDLAGAKAQKAKLIAALERDKAMHHGAWKAWRKAHPEDRPAFFEARGHLSPPVNGRLRQGYGPEVDARAGFKLMHHGNFYRAGAGEPVRAIYDGVVALAAKIPGFGGTIIVDHGDEYYSVYAFADKFEVREGDHLTEGSLLARAGQGSPLFGPGVYFELRHFTDAIDPKAWINDAFKEEPK